MTLQGYLGSLLNGQLGEIKFRFRTKVVEDIKNR